MERAMSHPPYCGKGRFEGRDDPRRMARAYSETRDPALRHRLVETYLPLVHAIARKYLRHDEPLEDLVQVGSVGLLAAIDRFEPDRGRELAAFAAPTIHGEIRNYLRDRSAPIRVPRRISELEVALRTARERLSGRLRRAPTTAELALEAGVPEADVAEVVRSASARRPLSLSGAGTWGEALERTAFDEGTVDVSETRLLVAVGFRALGARERRIMHLRYYAELSQAEIAREVGLSQIQVSRIIRASLERMRGALVSSDTDARPYASVLRG